MKESWFTRKWKSLSRFFRFLKSTVLSFGTTGSVAPSTNALARKVLAKVDWEKVKTVVEYGPGTGAFTKHILQQMKPSTRFIGVEINDDFIQQLRVRFPEATFYKDSVENIEDILAQEGQEKVDLVISALPWSIFSEEEQKKLMSKTANILKPNSYFCTIAYVHGTYLPTGKKFRNLVREIFTDVEFSKVVWNNIPPTIVYYCRT